MTASQNSCMASFLTLDIVSSRCSRDLREEERLRRLEVHLIEIESLKSANDASEGEKGGSEQGVELENWSLTNPEVFPLDQRGAIGNFREGEEIQGYSTAFARLLMCSSRLERGNAMKQMERCGEEKEAEENRRCQNTIHEGRKKKQEKKIRLRLQDGL